MDNLFTKLKIISIFYPIVLCYYTMHGQSNSPFELHIRSHPLYIIAIPRPSVVFSTELRYRQLGIDIGYGLQWSFPFSDDPDTVRVTHLGYRYNVELKYYVRPSLAEGMPHVFISLNYGKIYQRYNLTTDWFSG